MSFAPLKNKKNKTGQGAQDGLKGQAPGLFLLNAQTHATRLLMFFVFVSFFFCYFIFGLKFLIKQIIESN